MILGGKKYVHTRTRLTRGKELVLGRGRMREGVQLLAK